MHARPRTSAFTNSITPSRASTLLSTMAEWNRFWPYLALWQCLPRDAQKSRHSCVWTPCQSVAGLRRPWKRIATGAQWGWNRFLSSASLSFFSFLRKNSHHQTDVTIFSLGCVVALINRRQKWDAAVFVLGAWSGFAIAWCPPIWLRWSFNPATLLLINTVTKATEIVCLVFCFFLCGTAGKWSSLFSNHTNLSSTLWHWADF